MQTRSIFVGIDRSRSDEEGKLMEERRTDEPPVCAVILNWNRPADTLECLDSLTPFIRQNRLAVVVCDNASTDDSVDQISRWAKQIYQLITPYGVDSSNHGRSPMNWEFLLVQTDTNRGFSGGNNAGIREALQRTCFEFIWILNNDTVVHSDALDALKSCALNNPEYGIFGSTIVEYHSREVVQTAGGCRYNPFTTMVSKLYAGLPLSYVLELGSKVHLDYVSGAAMFCRTEVFRRVGLLDERFFLYYEELDLARRMRSVGYDVGWCKDSIVYHKGAVSTGGGTVLNKEESWESNYHENLSTLLYTRKHHLAYLSLVAVARFLGKSIALLLRRRFRLFSALITAYQDAFTGRHPVPAAPDAQARIVVAGTAPEVYSVEEG